jgi:hypothetical protein
MYGEIAPRCGHRVRSGREQPGVATGPWTAQGWTSGHLRDRRPRPGNHTRRSPVHAPPDVFAVVDDRRVVVADAPAGDPDLPQGGGDPGAVHDHMSLASGIQDRTDRRIRVLAHADDAHKLGEREIAGVPARADINAPRPRPWAKGRPSCRTFQQGRSHHSRDTSRPRRARSFHTGRGACTHIGHSRSSCQTSVGS